MRENFTSAVKALFILLRFRGKSRMASAMLNSSGKFVLTAQRLFMKLAGINQTKN